jgi:NAD+ synthase (glutamine-hydrolysing)
LEVRAELLINLSASPIRVQEGLRRERMLMTRAADATAVVAYFDWIGAQGGLVFHGQSIICGLGGEVTARASNSKRNGWLPISTCAEYFPARLHDPCPPNSGPQ